MQTEISNSTSNLAVQPDYPLDIFVGNYTIIDPDVYDSWLSGKNAQEACYHILGGEAQPGDAFDYQMSHICDQYRLYMMMEKFLVQPPRFEEQILFQLSGRTKKMLIEMYYEFDGPVVREFLGKKMSSKHRKDLDEVSDKTGVPIKSCRRQFDNVKRIYKTVEDTTEDLIPIIQSNFNLSKRLARKYAAVVYITNNRFETSKRKLQYLSLDDFLFCANKMRLNWSCIKSDCRYEETAMEIDREFLQNLREIKVVSDRDTIDELKTFIQNSVHLTIGERFPCDFDTNLKIISRTLINIANGLMHTKELKDLFIDIVEKIVEPIHHSRWSENELNMILNSYSKAVLNLESSKGDPQLAEVWERYMTTISECILKLYHF